MRDALCAGPAEQPDDRLKPEDVLRRGQTYTLIGSFFCQVQIVLPTMTVRPTGVIETRKVDGHYCEQYFRIVLIGHVGPFP